MNSTEQSKPNQISPSYKRELIAWAFLPMMMGAIEGGVVGVLTKSLFEDTVGQSLLDWAVASLTAAQGFANISSFLWVGLSHGKSKIRFIIMLKIAVVFMIAAIAFIPRTPLGLILLLVCVIGTRICWTGIVTLRTTIWQANYPRSNRALVAGKIATVQALVLVCVGLIIGFAMDFNEDAFRWIYPIAASFGIVGAWIYSKVQVKGHGRLLLSERATPHLGSLLPWRTFQLLFEDRNFAKYMSCQFIFGLGNLMLTAPLVVILHDQFHLNYIGQILIMSTIPIVLMPLSIPFWARFLARVHVLTFRSIHSWFFISSSICFGISIATGSITGLWIAAGIRGIGFGGGVLAWNLGHQDYAPVEQSGRYMGLHITLTGIRGLIAPAVGIGLYTLLQQPQREYGFVVFFLGAVISSIGGIGFIILARRRKAKDCLLQR